MTRTLIFYLSIIIKIPCIQWNNEIPSIKKNANFNIWWKFQIPIQLQLFIFELQKNKKLFNDKLLF